MRRPLLLVAAAVVAVVVVTACSDSESEKARPGPAPTEPPPPITFSVSAGDVHAVTGPAPAFPDDVRTKVTATLERYLADAVLGPLRSGQAAGDLGPVFTAGALARVNGPDRAALVDEGLPRAGDLRAEAATARLAALADAGTAVTVVAAAVDLRLHTGGADSVAIVRTGDLVLVADGDAWKIDGYHIRTARDSADGGVTTTTAQG